MVGDRVTSEHSLPDLPKLRDRDPERDAYVAAGDAVGLFNLGMRFYEGDGVSPDYAKAAQLLQLAETVAAKNQDSRLERDAMARRQV